MKKSLRASILATAFLSLSLLSFAPPARANVIDKDMVRDAQIRLTSLGYRAGPTDGVMGRRTAKSLAAFQRQHDLSPTGRLDQATYNLLMQGNHFGAGEATSYGGRPMSGRYPASAQPMSVDAPPETSRQHMLYDHWNSSRDQLLPMRFASMNIHEEDTGTMRHYTVTVNGQAILLANNQPGLLRVSQAYQLANQDVVIFTAYQGVADCQNKSYLLSVYADGSVSSPHEIGNCAASYEAHVANNTLILKFPTYGFAGWLNSDEWRYQDQMITRL